MIAADGVWPVMLTPFLDDRTIDWPSLDRLVDWYLEAGVAGLFTVCLSSEMYELEPDERYALAGRVVRRAAGRVPVIASGTFGATQEEKAAGVRRMADSGVDAVVCLANALAAEHDSEDAWRTGTESLLDRVGEVPLGLYECPQPYHRVLSADTLAWVAATGRFGFLKETSARLPLLEQKLAAVRDTPLRVFNADAVTLLASLRKGAAGFSGISANFVPELWVWLCRHAERHAATSARLHAFLEEAERTFARCYPASAKHFVSERGIPVRPICRMACTQPAADDLRDLAALDERADAWRRELRIGQDA